MKNNIYFLNLNFSGLCYNATKRNILLSVVAALSWRPITSAWNLKADNRFICPGRDMCDRHVWTHEGYTCDATWLRCLRFQSNNKTWETERTRVRKKTIHIDRSYTIWGFLSDLHAKIIFLSSILSPTIKKVIWGHILYAKSIYTAYEHARMRKPLSIYVYKLMYLYKLILLKQFTVLRLIRR